MFETAEPHIERIVALTKLCPEALQAKCFELLLSAYLESISPKSGGVGSVAVPQSAVARNEQVSEIPDVIRPRFNSLVQRTKVSPERAAALFDFTSDPFTYHALDLPEDSKRGRMRSLALMLCLKTWLVSAQWAADWKEFRALCLNYDCWEANNVTNAMLPGLFKTASSADGISLKSDGSKAAEALFIKLAGGNDSQ